MIIRSAALRGGRDITSLSTGSTPRLGRGGEGRARGGGSRKGEEEEDEKEEEREEEDEQKKGDG